ncbi:sodium:solute symporter family protein [Flammeovirgaceae bacterium SG7u.111]|nr:sodium:solute symporter family protein [Flammeovirgaceae bacterium SG7u.132]WPO35718.1 sodium:solute symporter family protein [Flammeovirgaceae bacterium SG7u.111]
MAISLLDWSIIALYFVVSIGIGIYMSKRAGNSTSDFFLSGRNLPWYVAGTSMVATTFAADTPLAVTELVAQNGIAGNWLWWNMLFGGMLTVFFFARLWRRANILTDAEFVSIRYSGKAARFLRGWRAVYIGVFMNVIVMAWVNLAMVKILTVIFPDFTVFGHTSIHLLGIEFTSHMLLVGGLLLFVAFYSSLSGLWGVSITDTFQFIMAMGGSIALAVYAVDEVGGIAELKNSLSDTQWVFDFLPVVGGGSGEEVGATGILKMSAVAVVAYLGVQWWASWYPGSEPGGGGYVAQRMMSAKDEKNSLLATLWFQVAHYAIRPWPWVLVALSTLVLYPEADDRGATYVMMIRDYLPSGLVGLLLAAFLAAYMSTIASQIVWGTSYIINDLYRPFIKPNAEEKFYVKVSKITTFLLMLFSLVVTTQLEQISDAWKLVLALSAGIGVILILRWFWWRINAWSEIAAMVAPYTALPILTGVFGLDIINKDFELCLLILVAWSTVCWLVVTLLTPPTDEATLKEFYRKVHPGGIGWTKISKLMPEVKSDTGYLALFLNWLLGCLLVIFSLFGIGKLLFLEYTTGLIYLIIALVSGFLIYRNFSKMGWEKLK